MRALRSLVCCFAIAATSQVAAAAPKKAQSAKSAPKKSESKKAEPKKRQTKKGAAAKSSSKKRASAKTDSKKTKASKSASNNGAAKASRSTKAPSKSSGARSKQKRDADDKRSSKASRAREMRKKAASSMLADEPTARVGPGAGSGSRSVSKTKPKTKAKPSAAGETPKSKAAEPGPAKEAKKDKPKSHRKGRRPRKPKATLPKGVERPTPNPTVRRAIAGGKTLSDLRGKPADPELEALRAADRVLFPKPLYGLQPGWAWSSAVPQVPKGPEVVASGLPVAARIAPKTRKGEQIATAKWLRTLTMPNLPVRMESRVVRYLKFYRDNKRGRTIARIWAKKSGRFAPALKAELAKAGLPTDLVWLSLIESGHNPNIHSVAGAAGLWQFMPDSGRMYGLVVDRWVDERLDPKRSTGAAIAYLSDLYRRFGNWELAMAGYNMGHGGLSRAIKKFNTNDYWELSKHEAGIPWETTLYVPKIFAIAIVMNNKRAFGIADVRPAAPERFESVRVPAGTPIKEVARAARVPASTIRQLNPQLLSGRVPPKKPGQSHKAFFVRVPAAMAVSASRRLAKTSGTTLKPYIAKLGDTQDSVAQTTATSTTQLKRINGLRSGETLAAGSVLLVPNRRRAAAVRAPEAVVVPNVKVRYPDRERVFLLVRKGDTLAQIARALGVSSSELQRWNSLDPTARLHRGMTIQAWVKKGSAVQARVFRPHQTKVLVAGTPEFIEHFEARRGKTRMVVKARRGETLARIGKRYGVSSGWMERINRRSRREKLKAGDEVVVYVRQSKAIAASTSAESRRPQPLPPVAAPAPEGLPGLPQSPSAASPGAKPVDG